MAWKNVVGIPSNLDIALLGEEAARRAALVAVIERGDKVTALFPGGLSIRDGKTVREWNERSGIVNPLLIFKSHVVINLGGKHGTPGVVDARNIVSVRRKS